MGPFVYLDKNLWVYSLDINPVAATNHLLQIRKDGFGMRTFSGYLAIQ